MARASSRPYAGAMRWLPLLVLAACTSSSEPASCPTGSWDEGWQTGYRTMRGCFVEVCLSAGCGLAARQCDGIPVYCACPGDSR